VAAS
jgi:hypothetical protein